MDGAWCWIKQWGRRSAEGGIGISGWGVATGTTVATRRLVDVVVEVERGSIAAAKDKNGLELGQVTLCLLEWRVP